MKAVHDNAPKEVNNWKVYSLAMIACMAAVMIGYDVSRPHLLYDAISSKP
jgi:hypothetical protein